MKKDKRKAGKVMKKALILLIPILMCCITQGINAQDVPEKSSSSRASQYPSLPGGYTQVGTTQLYYRQYSDAIDMIGYYNGYYYSSTYADYGYKLSIKVGNNSAVRVDCLNGTTTNGVTVLPSIVQQGELARICYAVTNNNEEDVVISLGTHADVMIGYNDAAPISRRLDTFEQTYGLTMKDGNGAQLCVLFGSGLAGVTAASDFWFGKYSLNSSSDAMVGNYSSGSYYMVENGSYDSGMGWCWKDRTIQAGTTIVFSYLIGVGEVNLEPNSTFEVTPDDQEGWNDLSRPHRLTLTGKYESPAGLDGIIDYAVEDSEDWQALTGTLASGDEFTGSLVATFDVTKSTHKIKFRTRDVVGNTTLLHPIEYKDVGFHDLSGIEDKTYTGDSIFQTNVSCDLNADQYALKAYTNNVNKGTASFNIEGVFPYTIGRKTYTFTINPQELSGDITIPENVFVYNGQPFTPDWNFTNEGYAALVVDQDYTISWSDNTLPGQGQLTVEGINNYCGTISATFDIDKAQLSDDLFTLTLPEQDITYDEKSHGASISSENGVGNATFYYQKQGEEATTNDPSEAGEYNILLEISDGSLYYGRERYTVGSFTIYQFSAEEWVILQAVLPQLSQMGWSQPWDVSQGMNSVSTLSGVTIEKGHVTGLDLSRQELTGVFPYFLLSFPNLHRVNLSGNHLSGDIGLGTYAFAQQNPLLTLALEDVDISDNQFAGNIGIFANCFANLTTLDASHNCLEDVYPMIPTSVTSLDISSQTISRVVPLELSSLSIEDLATKIPSILLYDHANQRFKTDINFLCSTKDKKWAVVLASKNGQLGMRLASEQNTYYGESGETLSVAMINDYGTPEGSTFFVSLSFDEGDGNFDGKVDIVDLQTTLNYMFGEYNTQIYNFTAANIYNDEMVNVQDIIGLVNLLLEQSASQVSTAARRTSERLDEQSGLSLFVEDDVVYINASQPVSALHIISRGDIEWDFKRFGFDQSHNANGVVVYSLSGCTLPMGMIKVGKLNGNAAILKASASTPDAIPLAISVGGGSTTGINGNIISKENCKYFSVDGVQKSSDTKGLRIEKRDHGYVKTINK